MPHVVVVGGGISGLTAAFRLSREEGVAVTLFEAGSRLGGKVATVPLGRGRVELGADSFLPRDERPLELCRELGLADELVAPSGFGGSVWLRGRLRPLPAGTVLGFPTSLRALVKARVLSPQARARAAFDLLRRRPLTGPDVAVATFTRRHFGREVLDRIVDPLLAGTRAGDVEEMSLAAAIPPVDAAARSHGSVMRGLARARARGDAGTPRFFAPRTGMQLLVDRLAHQIEGEIRLQTQVRSIATRADGFAVTLADGTLDCDGVVVTTPAHMTAGLIAELAPQASWHLSQIEHASCAVINLVFPRGSVTIPSRGSGVLIPSAEKMTISGCTWFSSKWPALAPDDGSVTIRCFVGRGGRDPALDLDDRDLVGVVLGELKTLVSIDDEPIETLVARWDNALPAYRVGHLDQVARIEQLLDAQPGLTLAGASYRGSGIPDCIAQADRAVASLLVHLQR